MNQEVAVQVLKDCGNGVTIIVDEFGDKSEGKGLKFAVPQFASGASADAVYGAEVVAGLLNTAIRTKVATKVKTNKFPSNVDAPTAAGIFQRMAGNVVDGVKGLIFSIEEALAYRPGDRVPGTKKLIATKLEQLVIKFRSGNLTQEQTFALLSEISDLQVKLAKPE